MATEAQILAILTGRKVFDGRQWRVYDAGGVELADSGGVLWRGVHGALLWSAALALLPVPVDGPIDTGDGWGVAGWKRRKSARAPEFDEAMHIALILITSGALECH